MGNRLQVPSRFRSTAAFTLLEILVSLSIVAIAVTVMLQLFSTGLRTIAASEDNALAAIKADARMREVLDSDELAETSWSESSPDGYRMDISILETLKERTNNLQVRVMQVALTTHWYKGNKEKTLTLKTLKTISKLAPGMTTTGGSTQKPPPGSTSSPSMSGTTSPRMGAQ